MAEAEVERLQEHLALVAQEPSTDLDLRLLESFGTSLTDTNTPPLIPQLLPQLLLLLPSLQQDPTSVTELITRLIKPLSFTDALSYVQGADTLVAALRSPSPSVVQLAIDFLRKALSNSSDVAILASMKDVVYHLVDTFLTRETGPAQQAQRLLEALLGSDVESERIDDADHTKRNAHAGQGLMWRRLFDDRDIYELFFSRTADSNTELDRKQRSVSQARLMWLLTFLSRLDFRAISTSHCADVEQKFGLEEGKGLLDYACGSMANTEDDVLLRMTVLDFYTDLLDMRDPDTAALTLKNIAVSCPHNTSPALDFLISRGVHAWACKFYISPDDPSVDPLEKSFLMGRSAHYVATYASIYPSHLISADWRESSLVDAILSHISKVLGAREVQRAHHVPSHDLHVLASMPRSTLIPRSDGSTIKTWEDSPVSRIPTEPTHEDFLKTLGVLFHGPDTEDQSEAVAARTLFLLYTASRTDAIEDICANAGVVALKDVALAAIGLLSSILTASWSRDNGSTDRSAPRDGVDALFGDSAEDKVLLLLLGGPRTFSNLVGGKGDVQSAAYKVATARFDLLLQAKRLLAQRTDREYAGILGAIDKAAAKGPWGNEGSVGGHIGTLEA